MLGQTLDDAAGEAFDKGRGCWASATRAAPRSSAAADGDPEAFEFPVAMTRDPGLDFSFSGLKTALVYQVRDLGEEASREARADLAASYQRAIMDQLAASSSARSRPAAGRRLRSAAASPPTPSCAGAPRRSARSAACA